MLPVIEVSRLPSASSFYAAVTQPLGIHYLAPLPALPSSSSSSSCSSWPSVAQCLTFGCSSSRWPLFQLRETARSRDRPLQTCQLVLSTDSVDAVADFHAAALKAFPRSSAVIGTRDSLDTSASATVIAATTSKSLDQNDVCARVTDPDGNIMAVAYRPSYSYSSPYGGSAVSRRHEFGEREPSQVISYDRHQSAEMPPYNGHPRHHASVSYYAESASHSSPSTRYHPGSSLRRAATTSSVSHEPPREHSGSMAGMLGMAAVGAVAGAALTYSVMSGRSSRSRRLEEPTTAPSFQRRSTYPDAYPEYGSAPSRYIGQEGMRARSRKPSLEIEEVLDYDDGRSRNSSSHRYRSSSRPAAGIRAITDTPPAHAPQLLLGEGDAMYGGGSYAPSRYDGSHAPSRRSTSRAPSRYEGSHAPLRYDGTRAPSQHEGSRASSRHEASRAPSQYEVAHAPSQYDSPHAPPLSHRSATFDTPGGGDRDSYVSSRSHRTEATLRGSSRQPSAPPSASRSAHVSHAASRSSSYRSARDVPLPPSRVSSYRSSRDVPLPPSGVGSSHARWDAYPDEDNDPMLFDDNDSVAPSDSISCVGSRGQRYH